MGTPEDDAKNDEKRDFLTFSKISQKCFPWLQDTLKTCSEAFSSDSAGSLMIFGNLKKLTFWTCYGAYGVGFGGLSALYGVLRSQHVASSSQ